MRYFIPGLIAVVFLTTPSGRAFAQQTPPDTVQKIATGRRNSAEQSKKPYVILISADGFRYDLADKYHATHLLALRTAGVAAAAMRPAYPSVTFPNHYSLATGLYPSHHGLVDNTFYDRKRGQGYRISDRAAVEDGTWYGGTPLWVLAEKQKMLSASFFWVGAEADVQGIHPSYYYRFNDKIPIDTRLQAVKDWLSLPEDRRPHMITFYLSMVDHAEHYHGVDSKETEDAVHLVDDCIGRMNQMLEPLHLPLNYIFVSDHGMTDVDTLHGISLPAAVDTLKFRVSFNETMLHLYANDKKDVRAAYLALKKDNTDFDTYLPDETPERWHYSAKDDRYDRIGDILLVSKFHKVFNLQHKRIIPGMHGYDNAQPEMGATFYAWGPAFKEHLSIPAFENVQVYPLIAEILGLTITEPIDGSPDALKGILR